MKKNASKEEDDITLFFPDISPKHFRTLERCKMFVSAVFGEIEGLHGEDAAQKIFEPYGRPLTQTDRNVRKDAYLLGRYKCMRPKPNAHKLARMLEAEGKSPTFEAALVWIKRVKNRYTKRGLAARRFLEYLEITA